MTDPWEGVFTKQSIIKDPFFYKSKVSITNNAKNITFFILHSFHNLNSRLQLLPVIWCEKYCWAPWWWYFIAFCCKQQMNEQNIWPIDYWRIIVELFFHPQLQSSNNYAREPRYNRNCFNITSKVLMLLCIADEKTINIENIINLIRLMRCFCSHKLWKVQF